MELQASVDIDFSDLKEFEKQIDSQFNNQSQGEITKAFKQWAARYRAWTQERFDKYSKGGGDWPPLKDSTKWRRRTKQKKPQLRLPKDKTKGKIVFDKKTGNPKANKKTGRAISKNRSLGGKLGAQRRKVKKQIENLKSKKRLTTGQKKRLTKLTVRAAKLGGKLKRFRTRAAHFRARRDFRAKKKEFLAKVKHSILRDTNTLFTVLTPVLLGKPGQLQQGIAGGIRVGFGGPATHPKANGLSIADIAEAHQLGRGNLPVRRIIVEPASAVVAAMADDMRRALKRLANDNGGGND